MLVNIAEHVINLAVEDLHDDAISALSASYSADSGASPEVTIAIPREAVERETAQCPDEEKARFVFAMLGAEFYDWLLTREAFCFHASAIEFEGRAYLFSAPSGTGKSTHTNLWRTAFGEKVRFINDDRPIIARKNGVWTAYGAPWCGKADLGENRSAPVGGVCYLKRGSINHMRRLNRFDAFTRVFSQTPRPRGKTEMCALMDSVEAFAAQVPVYLFECGATLEAVYAARDAFAASGDR